LAQATASMKAGTAAFVGELAAGTAARKADVASQAAEYGAAHQAMGREMRERLASESATRRADTRGFMVEVDSQLAATRAEVLEVRAAWQEHLAPPAPAPPPKVEVAPPAPKVEVAPPPPKVEVAPPAPKVEVAPPPPAVEEVVPDDLTVIRGIGPSMEARLNEAGVATYAQLAEASPEMIREKLGDFGRLAKVDDWIAQAEELI